jgi:hypothetical protein
MDIGGIRMPRIPTRIQKAMEKRVEEGKTNGMEMGGMVERE